MVAYVVDTPRSVSPQVFMSNMLQVPPGLHPQLLSLRSPLEQQWLKELRLRT